MRLVHAVPGDTGDVVRRREHTNFEGEEERCDGDGEAVRRPYRDGSHLDGVGIPHVGRVGGMPENGAGQRGQLVVGMVVERPVQGQGGMFVGPLRRSASLGVSSVV